MTEEALVEDLKDKKEHAFKQLVGIYQVKVRNTCMGMIHDKFEADDLAQEVFIEIFRSIHRFNGKSLLSTWIYRITINKCLNHIRSKKRKQWLNYFSSEVDHQKLYDKKSTEKHPHEVMEEREYAGMLKRAIDGLPENQRVAFVLRKYEELSNPEIASIMKTSVSSVESLNHRARKNLQKKLNHIFKKSK